MLDTEGVLLPADVDDPITFSLSGRPVWSFTPRRDGVQHQHGTWVPWPPVLRPYLDGVADVRLATADGTRELLDTRVRFGDSGRAVEVLDASGHPLIIDKVGHLSRAFADTADTVRREILRGTRRAIEDLREHAGVAAYLNYGALLGAVRDGAMISHDSDTDVCYLSRHAHPVDLVAESYRVERAMRARGWNLLRMSGGDVKLLLPLSDGRTCHIDVFVAFHVGETFYQLGNRSGTLPREAIVPFSTVTLDGLDFPAPADPEAMLAFLYGPRWRVPDPSFRYDDPPAGVRRLDGWLRGFRSSMGRWTEFYQSPAGSSLPREPSDFAAWVEATLPAGEPVAELGCGTGRDAAALARAGRSVVALDYNRVARRRTNRRAQREGLDLRTRMLLLGDLRSVLLSAAEIHHERRHVVARHLLGALDDQERRYLWLLARTALRDGGSLLLEFAATPAHDGTSVPDPQPAGLVRRLDPDRVVEEVTAAGGRVEARELVRTHDLVGVPDPSICRLQVSRCTPTAIRHAADASHTPPPQEPPMSSIDPRRPSTSPRRWRRAAGRGLSRITGRRATSARLTQIEEELQENRRLHRWVAELTDVVATLLVRLDDRDDPEVAAILEQYRASI